MTKHHGRKQRFAGVSIAKFAIILVANSAATGAIAQTTPIPPTTTTGGSNTSPAPTAETVLKTVNVTTQPASKQADVTGFGDVPAARTPISTTVISAQQIDALGAKRLADVLKLDASASDAYNAVGYWDYASVRGFVLDNKFNYRRDGLPISAETFIPLENKERVEILKGTSGIQAGTSAPGGLINYAVKRPTAAPLRAIKLEANNTGAVVASTDLGGRFGTQDALGYRFNLAAEKVNSAAPGTRGSRELAALALDWRIGKDTLLEAEIESSRRSQPSVPGLSLLGNTLPAANARLNINNQPWSLPVVLQGTTASLRLEQALGSDWRWQAQWGTQRLQSDDRIAFPFGCTDPNGIDYYADRYCPAGQYDLYDFRSNGERRRSNAVQLQLKGKLATGAVQHDLSLGMLHSSYRETGQTGAYNATTPLTVSLYAPSVVAPDPSATSPYTNRKDSSLEFSASDVIAWSPALTIWIGLRHTQLKRSSLRTDPLDPRPAQYEASITTPWLAASYQLSPALMGYASWGQGIESQVVPNKPGQYSNAGVALPPLKSRQTELGLKGADGALNWSLAWFQIQRPVTNLDACNRLGISPCQGDYDGSAVHNGQEANAQTTLGPWSLGGGVTLLNAKRQGSVAEPLNNGQRPTNVPNWVARLNAAYRVASLPGLTLSGHLSHEGGRNILPDGSITLPAWTRIDAGLAYSTTLAGAPTTWSLGVDNLLNRKFFKESPYQFGHIYLFPQQPRTLRIAFNASI